VGHSDGEARSRAEADGAAVVRYLWHFGTATFDESTLQLTIGNQPVAIEPKPQQLLLLMLHRAGEVITREEILESIWPGRIVTDGVISNCIAKLRTALDDREQDLIRTVSRFGYRLAARVSRQAIAEPDSLTRQTLILAMGAALPGRPEWIAGDVLSTQGQAEVRLVTHAGGEAPRVAKFARNAGELTALKREVTLNRVLQESHLPSNAYVRVLDWNFDEAPFFIQLEYSAHGSLVQWCEAQGGLAALPLATRIDLAAQCATATAEAHTAGVLHKDIKPSNVIVTLDAQGQPRIRLSDFAAGWVLDPELLSQMSATRLGFTRIDDADTSDAGTPMYVAPEVIRGQMSTAQADIYALGVMLFQLVVGDFRAVLAPGWESQIDDPLLRDDIATAANGDPAARFANADLLARRLTTLAQRREALIHEQRVEAELEETRMALIRAKARRSVLNALAATLAISSAAIGYLYWDARTARDEALEQSATAQAISGFLTDDLLSAADPRVSGNGDLRVRDLLDVGSETLDGRFSNLPVVKAQLQRVIGGAYGSLGVIRKAEPMLLAAEATLASHLGDTAPDTQATRFALRDAYRIAVQLKKMGDVGKRIVAAEERAGMPDPATWFEGRWVVQFAECLVRDGSFWLSDCGSALNAIGVEATEKLGADHPLIPRIHWITGVSLVFNGQAKEAEPALRQAAAGLKQSLGEKDVRYLDARLYWGVSLCAAGRQQEAIREIESVVSSFSQTFGRNQSLYRVAQVYYARCLVAEAQYEKAEGLLRDALEWRMKTEGPGAVSTLNGLESLAALLLIQDRPTEAIDLIIQVFSAADTSGKLNPYERMRLNAMLAHARLKAGQDAAAGTLLLANLTEARALLKNGQWYLGLVVGQWGNWLVAHDRQDEGIPLLQEAAQLLRAKLTTDHPHVINADNALVLARAGRTDLPTYAPTALPVMDGKTVAR